MSPEKGLNELAGRFVLQSDVLRKRLLGGKLTRKALKNPDLSKEEIDKILQAQTYYYKEKKRRGDGLVASMADALDAIRTGVPLPFTKSISRN